MNLKNRIRYLICFIFALTVIQIIAQSEEDSEVYIKRILESTEISLISSYYSQNGENAAVTSGIGTEHLTDAASNLIISIPLNANDILTIDASVSAYSSASSSNVNPFDSRSEADPFVESSGASSSDVWYSGTIGYSHSSKDRNKIITASVNGASEYDYQSVGAKVGFTQFFNEKNTSIGTNVNVFFDQWSAIYPIEIRRNNFGRGQITGNTNYSPIIAPFNNLERQSYALNVSIFQILSKKVQGILLLDGIRQTGLLSTPFHRINFVDIEDSIIENFVLADDIERLPDSRNKFAIGGRLNIYLSDMFILRNYFRYYTDSWGVKSTAIQIELPLHFGLHWTAFPSFRFYKQTQADFFAPFNEHLSSEEFYTSDYDLSDYNASQIGLGMRYNDIFTKLNVYKIGLKTIDLKGYYYTRNNAFNSWIISMGFNFVIK